MENEKMSYQKSNEIPLELEEHIKRNAKALWTGKGAIDAPFDPRLCYTNLFDADDIYGREVEKTSIYNILTLLSAEADIDPKNYLYETEDKNTGELYKHAVLNKEDARANNLELMMQFINFSCYIYDKAKEASHKDMNYIKQLVIVMASNMYHELYSSRGKIEFAYYLKKHLEQRDPHKPITAYNRDSWRGEYGKYTRKFNKLVDDKKAATIYIGENIAITFMKMKDENISPDMKKIIDVGIYEIDSDTNTPKDYERVAISILMPRKKKNQEKS